MTRRSEEPRAVSAERALREAANLLRRAGVDTPRLDAEILLCQTAGLRRESLLAHPEELLPAEVLRAYRRAVSLRAERRPLAYITGRREFYSLDFEVGPGVLVPRPETELLVDVAVSLARTLPGAEPFLADVGTGCGAVAVALACLLPRCRVAAGDISNRALDYARRNVLAHGLEDRVELQRGDLLEAVSPDSGGGGRLFDGVVANLPYIPDRDWDALPPEVRGFEPPESLLGGPDGLGFVRRLARQLPDRLAPGGFVCLEVGPGQASPAGDILRATGLFDAITHYRDLAGRERVVAAEGLRRGSPPRSAAEDLRRPPS